MLVERLDAPSPEALATMDAIARCGNLAAGREPSKSPSALPCRVRQTGHALDELPFERIMRQPHRSTHELASQPRLRRLDIVAARQAPASGLG